MEPEPRSPDLKLTAPHTTTSSSSVTHSSKPLTLEYWTLKVSYILFKSLWKYLPALKIPKVQDRVDLCLF